MPWPRSGIGSEVFHLPALVKFYQTVVSWRGMGQGLELQGGKGKIGHRGCETSGAERGKGRQRFFYFYFFSHFTGRDEFPCGIYRAQLQVLEELLKMTEPCPPLDLQGKNNINKILQEGNESGQPC